MPDGIRLAVDVYLPKGLDANTKVPAIMMLTRYVRSIRAKGPFRYLKPYITTNIQFPEVAYYVKRGYAVVVVDTRGSGASFGVRKMEFSPEEVADGYHIVDWVIRQGWSNGKVGATGVSYVGTTASLLVANQHPAVKAVAPRCSIFDLFGDLAFYGGMRQGPFIRIWGHTTKSLDSNNFKPFSKLAPVLHGISPVDGDRGMRERNEAFKLRRENFDFVTEVNYYNYRDDIREPMNVPIDHFSVHHYLPKLQETDTHFLWVSGWYDGGLVLSNVKGFLNTDSRAKMLIGPFDHGPKEMVSPHWDGKTDDRFLAPYLAQFFDYHLKDGRAADNGWGDKPAVTYYTMGEERYKHVDAWPTGHEGQRAFYLGAGRTLSTDGPAADTAEDHYRVDYTAGTGGGSRWNTQTDLYRYEPIGYPRRAEADKKLLCYDSEPLIHAIEVTGHGYAQLHLRANNIDAGLYCYLEEVLPDGRVIYVTEGLMRAKFRDTFGKNQLYKTPLPMPSYNREDAKDLVPGEPFELMVELLPTSYLFRPGSRIRLAIAGHDVDHFDKIDHAPSEIIVRHGQSAPSALYLPVVDRF